MHKRGKIKHSRQKQLNIEIQVIKIHIIKEILPQDCNINPNCSFQSANPSHFLSDSPHNHISQFLVMKAVYMCVYTE